MISRCEQILEKNLFLIQHTSKKRTFIHNFQQKSVKFLKTPLKGTTFVKFYAFNLSNLPIILKAALRMPCHFFIKSALLQWAISFQWRGQSGLKVSPPMYINAPATGMANGLPGVVRIAKVMNAAII